uniref:Polygalacturonase n=1 Tax=Kalanchoe fedtschenkoi TaxID=63787 RepID=A0A7N0UZK0_KALFE
MHISHGKLSSFVVSLLSYLILFSFLEDYVISAGTVQQNEAPRDDNGRAESSDGLEIVEPDEKVFNVMQYRDKATSIINDYDSAFSEVTIDQKMMWITFDDACKHPGKARMVIPKGQYKVNGLTFPGPCRSKRIVIQLFGDLIGPTDSSLLPNPYWIDFYRLSNVILLGTGGTIDGSLRDDGINCGDDDECVPSTPCNVLFEYCSNMIVKGIISIYPRAHHLNMEHCSNMTFENLYLNTLARSSDTDGISARNSSFIKISNSVIATGGDCISLDDGSTNFDISNITCGPGRGIRLVLS